jgi:hypothetical protein
MMKNITRLPSLDNMDGFQDADNWLSTSFENVQYMRRFRLGYELSEGFNADLLLNERPSRGLR